MIVVNISMSSPTENEMVKLSAMLASLGGAMPRDVKKVKQFKIIDRSKVEPQQGRLWHG